MRAEQINSISGKIALVLSLIALLTVLSGYLQPPQPCEQDEGSAAHIFQLSIAALAPTLICFFTTADWKRPLRTARPLAIPAAALALALGTLYCVEHYRCIAMQPRIQALVLGGAKFFASSLYE